MTVKAKKMRLLALLASLCLLLAGCGELPPAALQQSTPEGQTPLSAEPEAGAAREQTATLYFRYGDSALLRQETRELTVMPNESREKALVTALLDGPHEGGGSALFPDGTQVLSTQAQDGVIYVTFNEALYDRYPDESLSGQAREQAILRRRLAMAALCATLTESGEYRAVQVLVRAESNVGSSMRLRESYFLADSELPCDALTREETYLPTPAASARLALAAWQTRDWESLSQWIAARGASAADIAPASLAKAQTLLAAQAGEGCVSPDGQSAVVCVNLTLRGDDGAESACAAWPLRMIREGGVWKIPAAALLEMMQAANK